MATIGVLLRNAEAVGGGHEEPGERAALAGLAPAGARRPATTRATIVSSTRVRPAAAAST